MTGNSMYKKYVEEYRYRKPIFENALLWYKDEFNQNELKILRLKNSECWVIQRVDGKDIELRMKDYCV
jgi:hypothetical protein